MRPEDLLARLEAGYEYDPMYGRLCNERDQLKAENAKLRELLRDTLPFVDEEAGFCVPADCFMYPACCDYDGDEECPAVARIHERARELGVETNDV